MEPDNFEFEMQIIGNERVRLVIYNGVDQVVHASQDCPSVDAAITEDLIGLQARLQPARFSPKIVDAIVSDYWGVLRAAPVVDMRPGTPCLSCSATGWRWKRRKKCSECYYGSPLKFERGDVHAEG